MSNCKKCNKPITNGHLCERCRTLRIEKIKNVGTVLIPVASVVVMVATNGKIKLKLKK